MLVLQGLHMSRCCTDRCFCYTNYTNAGITKVQVLHGYWFYSGTGITKLKALHKCRYYKAAGAILIQVVHKC